MNRLLPIEGLRGYLALWVAIGHVMFLAGINAHGSTARDFWTGAAKLFGDGPYAVHIFMIVSGFVIFYLLDHRHEPYVPFLIRRFFRLYPVYLLLLLVAIFVEPYQRGIIQLSPSYTSPEQHSYYAALFQTTADHPGGNILLHLFMWQGGIPESWLGPMSPYTYIISAWSIAVEWQFYLVAPLLYFLIASPRSIWRLVICGGFVLLYLTVILPGHLPFGPVLPNYLGFFLLGIGSYFLHKNVRAVAPDAAFSLSVLLAALIYLLGSRQGALIPLVLWIAFLGLLCEPSHSLSARGLLWLFNNPLCQYLGAISYGIYLSHELAMTAVQGLLLRFYPGAAETTPFAILLPATIALSIGIASLLHHLVELPGIALGKRVTARFRSRPLSVPKEAASAN